MLFRSIVYLRMGKISGVEVDGEQIRVVSRFGRAAEFSVRDVSSVSRSLGWIVLYDREFKTLAKVDSYLEHMEIKEVSGILWDKDVIYCLEMGKAVNIHGSGP